MRKLFTDKALTIAPGQAVSGVTKRMLTLQIVSGSVWITVEGLSHDYWLSAGDNFAAIPGRLIVIEADKTASCVKVPPAMRPALPQLRTWLGATMRRALHGSFIATLLLAQRSHASQREGCGGSSCPD